MRRAPKLSNDLVVIRQRPVGHHARGSCATVAEAENRKEPRCPHMPRIRRAERVIARVSPGELTPSPGFVTGHVIQDIEPLGKEV